MDSCCKRPRDVTPVQDAYQARALTDFFPGVWVNYEITRILKGVREQAELGKDQYETIYFESDTPTHPYTLLHLIVDRLEKLKFTVTVTPPELKDISKYIYHGVGEFVIRELIVQW
jgi:hypothetical protein